jgi:hypothetical protein
MKATFGPEETGDLNTFTNEVHNLKTEKLRQDLLDQIERDRKKRYDNELHELENDKKAIEFDIWQK